jgi:hypothetical protein
LDLQEPSDSTASIVFYNGDVITIDEDLPTAAALGLRGNAILAVGDAETVFSLASSETTFIDLDGRTLMPSFVDAHTHILNEPSFGDTLAERQAVALSYGVTTLGNLWTDEGFLKEMQAFDASGELRIRTSLYLIYNQACGEVVGEWYLEYPPTRTPGETLWINGVKLYTDGGSCNSPSISVKFAPDTLDVEPYVTVDELAGVITAAQSIGHQMAIHAIGDRAIDVALDGIERALIGEPNTYRHRIEHSSVLRPDQLPRYGEIGVVATVFADYPTCTPFGEPPFPEYQAWEWPYADLIAANPDLHVAWHGDVPYFSVNPLVQLYGFVTRYDVNETDGSTCEPSPWLADDTLPVERALRMMTLESAYALFREQEVGSLEVGKYADLIVLSENPLTVEASRIKDISVLMTMVNGEIVHCAAEAAELCP